MCDEVCVDRQVTCRGCGRGPYTPSFLDDFHEDGVAGPGTGLCDNCLSRQVCTADFAQPPMEITEEQAKNVCRGEGGLTTCRFLVSGFGFHCAKGSSFERPIVSCLETGEARGDNCLGPPEFVVP